MAAMRDGFFEGARETGTAESVIDELWAVNEAAADYCFNKSHAACYALISYRTAWLKANYPAEYMAALISSVMSTKDKVPFFVSRCEEMGIEVLPPDVNHSDHDFVVVGGAIRFGLDAVKNVGSAAVDRVIEAREEGGPFTSIWDFCERVDCRAVNKKAIESLVKCGALDSTGDTRAGMLEILPQAQGAGQKAQQDALLGQGSIFDFDEPAAADGGGGPNVFAAPTRPPVPRIEDEPKDRNVMEKETLGLFLSSHPLKEVRPALRAKVDCSLAEVGDEGRRLGHRRRHDRRVQEDPDEEGRHDDVRHPRRPRGPGRDTRLQLRLRRQRGARSTPTRSCSSAAASTTRRQGETKIVVQDVESFEPTPEEVEKARAAAPQRRRRSSRRVTLAVDGSCRRRSSRSSRSSSRTTAATTSSCCASASGGCSWATISACRLQFRADIEDLLVAADLA